MKTESKKLFVILLIAFILRISLVLFNLPDLATAESDDTVTYFDFAYAIMQGHLWDGVSAHRTPGYPLYLAMVQQNVLFAILGQIVFSLVSVWLTYLLAQKLFNERNVAVIAAAFLAVSQESITHSYYLLTETLFTLLLLSAVFFLVRYRDEKNWRNIFLCAIFMGYAILTRPVAIYIPFLLLFLFWIDQGTWKLKLKNSIIFLTVVFAMVGGWVFRNYQVHQLPAVSSISSTNLLYYNAASLKAWQSGENEALVRKELQKEVDEILAISGIQKTEANVSDVEKDLAWSIIMQSPIQYGFIHLKSDINNLLPDTDLLEVLSITSGQSGTLDFIKQNGLFAGITYYFNGSYLPILLLLPFILVLGLEYIGGLVGTVRLIKNRNWYVAMALLMPILYGVLIPGSPSNPRFRVPVMPYLVILAAFGMNTIINKLKTRPQKTEVIE